MKGVKTIKIGDTYGHLEVLESTRKYGRPYWICKCLKCGDDNVIKASSALTADGGGYNKYMCTPCAQSKGGRSKVGDKYNMLTIVEILSDEKKAKCRCDCGEESIVSLNNLRTGGVKTCGCRGVKQLKKGEVYGEFTILEPKIKGKSGYCLVRCSCGTEKVVYSSNVRGGKSTSCGCINVNGYSRSDFIAAAKGRNARLYVIRCFNEDEEFYKIGITSHTVEHRFGTKYNMPYNYEILHQVIGEPGYIYDLETEIHKAHVNFKYTPKIHFRGCVTECFSNILFSKN